MKVREALKTIVEEGDAEHICRPFCLYSRLADLVGADYCERDKLDLLFETDRRLSLVERLMGQAADEAERLREEFLSLQDLCSKREFDEILDIAASALVEGYVPLGPAEPNEFEYGSSDKPKTEEKPKKKEKAENRLPDESRLKKFTVVQLKEYCRTHGIKGYSSLNKLQLIQLIMQSNGKPAPKANAATHRPRRTFKFRTVAALTFFAALIGGIVCLAVFAKQIQWYQWQHMIGSVGGLLICGVGFLLSLGTGLFMNAIMTNFDGYLMTPLIVNALLTIANFVLAFVFGEAYIIIFYWLCGYFLLANLIGIGFGFFVGEKRARIFGMVGAVVIAGMITSQVLIQVL